MGSKDTLRALEAARRNAQRELLRKQEQDKATDQAIAEVGRLEGVLMDEIRSESKVALANPEQAARKPREQTYGEAA